MKMMKHVLVAKKRIFIGLLMGFGMMMLILHGCAGSGQDKLYKGRLIDGKVQGVEYLSGTRRGLTDGEGAFYYAEGDKVTFYIGDVLIGGPVFGKALISPLDFVESGSAFTSNPAVINICRLLQSLDVDGNLDNGIYISAEIREHFKGMSLDFSLSPEAFEQSSVTIDLFQRLNASLVFTDPGPRALKSSHEALSHFHAVMAEFGLGRFVLIALGDGYTAGSQSGGHNLNEYTQAHGYAQVLANHLNLASNLFWSSPLLSIADDGGRIRKEPQRIPFNLAIPDASIKGLITEKTGAGNHLLDLVLEPISTYTGTPVSQLEAAEYVANLYPDRKKIFVMTAGFNDVLGAATQNDGSQLTMNAIRSYFSDAEQGHDMNSLTANLTLVTERLRSIPNSYFFLANLPYVESLGALFYKTDLEYITGFDYPQISAINADEAIGYKAFLSLTGAEFNHALGIAGTNDLLNEALRANASDENMLSAEEAALINARVDEFNRLVKSLTERYDNVFLIDANALFQAVYNREIVIETTELSGAKTQYQLSRTFGGGFYSLDGVHPSHTGYGLIADIFISGINQAVAIITIPSVNTADIWNSEPYWDKDGDAYVSGPTETGVIDSRYIPLLDCDDNNPLILSPQAKGNDCN